MALVHRSLGLVSLCIGLSGCGLLLDVGSAPESSPPDDAGTVLPSDASVIDSSSRDASLRDGAILADANCAVDDPTCPACPPGLNACGSPARCVDKATDNENCGACGNICGFACAENRCVDVMDIAAGEDFTCALTDTPEVYCWGAPSFVLGALDQGSGPLRVELPPGVVPTKLDCGEDACCLLDRDGQILCWGEDPSILPTPSFGPITIDAEEAMREVAVGADSACVLGDSGQVHCWGDNARFQLGRGESLPFDSNPAPVTSTGGTPRVGLQWIASGWYHACAGTSFPQSVLCWGDNEQEQLGTGLMRDQIPFPNASVFAGSVASLDGGDSHTCAVDGTDGSVVCWGDADSGLLGPDGPDNSSTFEAVSIGVFAEHVAVGQWHSCAWSANAPLWCWGHNDQGQVDPSTGNDVIEGPRRPPLSHDNGYEDVALGSRHSCSLVFDAVYCWGDNSQGQVRPPATSDRQGLVRTFVQR